MTKPDSEFLDCAAKYIEEHGWHQGSLSDAAGAVCLIGALSACGGGGSRQLYELLTGISHGLAEWNDTPGRTPEEVIDLLAIASAEAAWLEEGNTNP